MNDRILWGQIAAVFLIILLAVWGATQWTAAALAFQPELGEPWFRIGDYPVYLPPAFFWWWFAFDAYAPPVFYKGALIAASGGFASIIVAIAMSVWRARERRKAETYGSARWASRREVRAADMLGDEGVVLGRFGKDYLRHNGAEHILCFAPTRSGKGVGLVVPTLLTWPGSCIVHDIKGENWQLTAGFRALHGNVLLFDPTNAKSSAYNPLLEVRRGEWEVRDVQNVADVLVDPEGSLEKRNHWEKTSHALLVGTILHILYAEDDKSLAGVAAFLSNPRRPIVSTLRRMQTTRHLGDKGVHPVVAAAAQELLNKSDNERSGVLSTAMSFLGLYRDPVIAAVTGRSDWRIADLMAGDRPTSLYLVVPPGDISRTKPLIRLILNQIGRRLTEELNPGARPRRLLLMLDEFPALGRLDFFESALAFMAGYGIKAFLIAQSLNQIEKAYGQNNAILDNCHVRVSFATREGSRASDGAPGQSAPPAPAINSSSAEAEARPFLGANGPRRTDGGERILPLASPYVVQSGNVIPAALITGIRSDLPGQIIAQVTQNIYDSPTGRILLISQGSRLIGEYDNEIVAGQNRVLLAWDRLILPGGRSIALGRLPGADAAGMAGLADRTDYHWGHMFKAALISTLLGVGAELGTDDEDRLVRAIRSGSQDSIGQTGRQIVERQLAIPPTITVRPGFAFRVIVTRDLVLEPLFSGESR